MLQVATLSADIRAKACIAKHQKGSRETASRQLQTLGYQDP